MTALVRSVGRERGPTPEGLAAATGLTKSYVSAVERGHSTPSGGCSPTNRSLEKIAGERAGHPVASATGPWRPPCSASPCRRSAFARARTHENAANDPRPEHAGQEFVLVHAGSVELGAADSAHFDASVGHEIRALGTEPAEVVVIATRAG